MYEKRQKIDFRFVVLRKGRAKQRPEKKKMTSENQIIFKLNFFIFIHKTVLSNIIATALKGFSIEVVFENFKLDSTFFYLLTRVYSI